MYKRRVRDVAAVTLKYFFDFDYVYFSHASAIFLILPCFFMLMLNNAATLFYDGLLTVKEDANEIKSVVRKHSHSGVHKAATFLHDGLVTVKEDARDIRMEVRSCKRRLLAFYQNKLGDTFPTKMFRK
jgi:hypothetical protein